MFRVGDVISSKIHKDRDFIVQAVSDDGTKFQIILEGSSYWWNFNDNYQLVFSPYEINKRLEYLERKTGHRYSPPVIPEGIALADEIVRIPITFEQLIDCVDGRSLQSIFRNIEDNTLAGVLYHCDTPERVDKIRKNVSKNHFSRLLDEIKTGWINNTERYVEEFVRTCRQLEEMGEIVIARSDEVSIDVYGGSFTETPDEKEKRRIEREAWWDKYKEERIKQQEQREQKVKDWITKMGL